MLFSKPRILFLSSGDPLRSLVAAGILRQHVGRRFRSITAAVHSLHPEVYETLQALGVPARGVEFQDLSAIAAKRFDYVITLCDCDHEPCPRAPDCRHHLHWKVDEPPGSAEAQAATLHRWRDRVAVHVRRFIYNGMQRSAPKTR